MESAAVLRPPNSTVTRMHLFEGSSIIPTYTAAQKLASNSYIQGLAVGRKFLASPMMHKGMIVSCAKTPETAVSTKSDVSSEIHPKQSLEKHGGNRATFPNGFEALVLEVCDGTDVAELKLKVGDFEMHMKRNVGTKAPMPLISPTTPPPIPTKPMDETASSTPVLPPKSSEKTSPFANVSLVKASKLASLEASGFNSYVLVSSPTVGSFRRGRTLKGKRQPHTCKEGDVIKEGQVIGYLDQFGTELPVKSDVAGEVLKLLYDDGEAVGYGDPLVAVLPSFHSIKL